MGNDRESRQQELARLLLQKVDDFPRSFIGKVPRQELARRYEEGQR